MTAATDSWDSTVSFGFMAGNAGGVSVEFDGDGLQLTKGSPVTLTLFALPVDFDDLKLTVSVSEIGTPSAVKRNTISLTKTSGAITFAACKKHVLKGLVNPEVTKIIEINSMVVDWENQGGSNVDIIP